MRANLQGPTVGMGGGGDTLSDVYARHSHRGPPPRPNLPGGHGQGLRWGTDASNHGAPWRPAETLQATPSGRHRHPPPQAAPHSPGPLPHGCSSVPSWPSSLPHCPEALPALGCGQQRNHHWEPDACMAFSAVSVPTTLLGRPHFMGAHSGSLNCVTSVVGATGAARSGDECEGLLGGAAQPGDGHSGGRPPRDPRGARPSSGVSQSGERERGSAQRSWGISWSS